MKIKTEFQIPDKKQIQTIAHLADIHIRPFKRHKEFRHVFSNLYKDLMSKKPDLIVLAGDIVHSKTEMSPELVELAAEFLDNLSKIAYVLLFPGNHDANLNNSNRLDALTPIIDIIDSDKIFYLKDSGVWKINNLYFSHMSIFDERKILAKDIPNDGTKIALYHGVVDASTNEFGFRLDSTKMSAKDFEGYNYGFLGDIHKRQSVINNIDFPGSLIQNNHGESLDHGYLFWDLTKGTKEFVKIHNDWGYYTLELDSMTLPDVIDMPKKVRLRLKLSNLDSSKIQKLLTKIRKKWNPIEITINRMGNDSSKEADYESVVGFDPTDVNYQNDLLKNYILENFPTVSDESIEKIISINTDINTNISLEEIPTGIKWELKSLRWNNLFSYGESNHINFKNINGVVGLFGPNATGKSAVLDVLSFALYDKTSRESKPANIMNNSKHNLETEVSFTIGDETYFINREAHWNKSNKYVLYKVNFWKLDEAGNEINLNGENRWETNRNITSHIGSFEDFILTSFSIQNNNSGFIDKGNSERKDLIIQFMGLNFFDRLYDEANNIYKNIFSDYKFQRDNYNYQTIKLELEKILDIHSKKYEEASKKQTEIKNNINLLTKQIQKLSSKKLKLDDDIKYTEEEVDEKIKNIETEIEASKILLSSKKEELQKIENHISKIDLDSYNLAEISNELKEIKKIKSNINDIKSDIKVLEYQISSDKDKMKKLEDLEYDENCTFCMNNVFVKDAIVTKDILITNKLKLQSFNDDLLNYKNQLKELTKFEELNEAYLNDKHRLSDLKLDLTNCNNDIIKIEYSIKDNKDKIYYYKTIKTKIHNNIKVIETNKKIDNEIKEIESAKLTLEAEENSLNNKLVDLYSDIKMYKIDLIKAEDNLVSFLKLEKKVNNYSIYLDCIKRDGIPYTLIKKALPLIESEINNILSQIINFSVILDLDENKNINVNIVYDEDRYWSIELASGMEKFISSIAIRVALSSISNLPRPNFLLIDEGWGNLDEENLNWVSVLLQYLKTYFDFIITISHIEHIQDVADSMIEIAKYGNFSKINMN